MIAKWDFTMTERSAGVLAWSTNYRTSCVQWSTEWWWEKGGGVEQRQESIFQKGLWNERISSMGTQVSVKPPIFTAELPNLCGP